MGLVMSSGTKFPRWIESATALAKDFAKDNAGGSCNAFMPAFLKCDGMLECGRALVIVPMSVPGTDQKVFTTDLATATSNALSVGRL